MPKPFRVAAAIHSGTHGTGFAWAAVSQDNSEPHNRRISLFEDWPDQSIASPKNRSAVLLTSAASSWPGETRQADGTDPPRRGLQAADRFKTSLQPGPRNATPWPVTGRTPTGSLCCTCSRSLPKPGRPSSGASTKRTTSGGASPSRRLYKYTRDLMFRAAGRRPAGRCRAPAAGPRAGGWPTVPPGEGRDSAKHGRDALPRGGRRQQGGHLLLPGGRRRTPERAGVAHPNFRAALIP